MITLIVIITILFSYMYLSICDCRAGDGLFSLLLTLLTLLTLLLESEISLWLDSLLADRLDDIDNIIIKIIITEINTCNDIIILITI